MLKFSFGSVLVFYGLVALVTSLSVSRHLDLKKESGTAITNLAPEALEDSGILLVKIKRSVHHSHKKVHPKRDYNTIQEVLKSIKSICTKKIVDQVGAVYQFDVKGNLY